MLPIMRQRDKKGTDISDLGAQRPGSAARDGKRSAAVAGLLEPEVGRRVKEIAQSLLEPVFAATIGNGVTSLRVSIEFGHLNEIAANF